MKKVKIYTFADKAPYFIPWQYKSFKDHVQDDFEYIVMNNSSSTTLDSDIKNHCSSLAVQCIDVEHKDFSHACFACAAPVQESLDRFISKDRDCLSFIVDSDVFLMRDFNFNKYMEGWDMAGLPQSRETNGRIIEYIWNAFIIIDNDTCPNLETLDMGCGTYWHAPLDVGGFSYFYLQANPQLKFKRVPTSNLITNHPEVIGLIPEQVRNDYEFRFDMEVLQGDFLHFRGGSRWNVKTTEFYEAKENFIRILVGA
jgi:hypothetical protein